MPWLPEHINGEGILSIRTFQFPSFQSYPPVKGGFVGIIFMSDTKQGIPAPDAGNMTQPEVNSWEAGPMTPGRDNVDYKRFLLGTEIADTGLVRPGADAEGINDLDSDGI